MTTPGSPGSQPPRVEFRPMTRISVARTPDSQTPVRLADERQRIAHEIHRTTVHRLFAIGLKLQALSSASTDAAISDQLDTCVHDLDVAISDLRARIFNLSPRNV
jgi:signal transduction histidine kinase